MNEIDFVVLWVDGNDEKWQKEKTQYAPVKTGNESSASRYRDWDTFHYWFRSVEKYAPWVRKVHFITWGHIPTWLNPNHPKLNIVRHTDFIPKEYLPTFNSNVIELNLFRIPDLAEQFVLFNDDMFLISPVKPEDFFRDGKICDEMMETTNTPSGRPMIINHTNINNMSLINRHFSKKNVIRQNIFKYYNPKYGKSLIRAICFVPFKDFICFRNPHLPISHFKSTFSKVWECENDVLYETCCHRFRTNADLSHWVMRYWNLCEGIFVPRSPKVGQCFTVPKGTAAGANYISKQKGLMVCINDASVEFDFDQHNQMLVEAFNTILPVKSSFEK